MRSHRVFTAVFVAFALVAAFAARDAEAQSVGGLFAPTDGESFDNQATIGVSGYVAPAPTSIIIKMRRVSTGTIYQSVTQFVPNQGDGGGHFEGINLTPNSVTGWPVDDYTIELWVGSQELANVTIHIVSS